MLSLIAHSTVPQVTGARFISEAHNLMTHKSRNNKMDKDKYI